MIFWYKRGPVLIQRTLIGFEAMLGNIFKKGYSFMCKIALISSITTSSNTHQPTNSMITRPLAGSSNCAW